MRSFCCGWGVFVDVVLNMNISVISKLVQCCNPCFALIVSYKNHHILTQPQQESIHIYAISHFNFSFSVCLIESEMGIRKTWMSALLVWFLHLTLKSQLFVVLRNNMVMPHGVLSQVQMYFLPLWKTVGDVCRDDWGVWASGRATLANINSPLPSTSIVI